MMGSKPISSPKIAVESSTLSKDEAEVKGASNPNMRPEYHVAEEIKWYNINTNCKSLDLFQKAKLSIELSITEIDLFAGAGRKKGGVGRL
ncbi:hypothetical protein C5167_026362, partial [Papaver somniferum]